MSSCLWSSALAHMETVCEPEQGIHFARGPRITACMAGHGLDFRLASFWATATCMASICSSPEEAPDSFLFIVVKYILHKIHSSDIWYTHSLGDHHHCPVSEHFPHPKRKSCTHLAVTPYLPPSPCLKQPLICFLFLWIYLFWIFHISGIIQYCVWLLSLCIMFSRFTHFIACVSTSFLFMAA